MNASNGRSDRAALGLGAALGVLLVATPGGAFHLEDGLHFAGGDDQTGAAAGNDR